jgi:hypothetical protein
MPDVVVIAIVLVVAGVFLAFIASLWRRPRVETRADLGRVPLTRERVANFLDLEGRRED